jgi:hypothetical protein
MREDIPQLCEEWMKSNEDIMNRAPERLPPLREVNHRIPIMDENKRYKYHSPRCLDFLKPGLIEKIAQYTHAGWWEPIQVDQAAPMLCIHKKTMALRTVVDRRQRNENTIKDADAVARPRSDLTGLSKSKNKIKDRSVRYVRTSTHSTKRRAKDSICNNLWDIRKQRHAAGRLQRVINVPKIHEHDIP